MKHLLPVMFVALAGCGSSEPERSESSEWFRDVAEETGLRFTHDPGLSGKYYLTEIMGSGAALLDYDNDGDLDVFLIQGHPGKGTSRLFRNELNPTGKLAFTDVTEGSGLAMRAVGMGVAVADYDNDGFVDIYVSNFGDNFLFRNNGNGTFTDVTAKARVNDPRWSSSSAFLDYDRDGHQDLIVLNYTDFSYTNHKPCFTPNGESDYCSPKVYQAVPATLFRNNGDGTFTDATSAAGLDKARGPGLGVSVADYDLDGWLDIFVANDGQANLLWMNQRDGIFREEALMRGVAYSEDGVAKAGMGVSSGDYDNDGDEDVFVANLTGEGGTLFRNDGNASFTDAGLLSGLRPITMMLTGFGLQWFDFDHDGFLDLFIANGAVTKIESLRGHPYPFQQRNLLLKNLAGQGRFEDVSARAGRAFSLSEVTRGACFGDIDNDGDIDILITNNNGPARLLLNQTARGNWIVVKLSQENSGALLALKQKGKFLYWRRAGNTGSYLSMSDPRVHFAWPAGVEPDELVVRVAGRPDRALRVEPRAFIDAAP